MKDRIYIRYILIIYYKPILLVLVCKNRIYAIINLPILDKLATDLLTFLCKTNVYCITKAHVKLNSWYYCIIINIIICAH